MSAADPHLTLAPLCAAAAAGRLDAVLPAACVALDAGCSSDEVREALLTVAPFCGFPRALDALALVRAVVASVSPEPPHAPLEGVLSRGTTFFDRVYGRDAPRVRAKLGGIDGEVAEWILHDAYGKVLSRPGIPASLRERIAVVLLAAQGLRNQLSGHVQGALNCGATAAEVAAFVEAAAPFLAEEELAFARETVRRVSARVRV